MEALLEDSGSNKPHQVWMLDALIQEYSSTLTVWDGTPLHGAPSADFHSHSFGEAGAEEGITVGA